MLVFHLGVLLAGDENGLWLAPVGIGIVLTAWLGLWTVVPLGADLLLVRIFGGAEWSWALVESFWLSGQIGFSWWCYSSLGQGARRLDDPRSAVVFLILVPGALAGFFALVWAFFKHLFGSEESIWNLAGTLWVAQGLGILVLVPPLLVTLTPLWVELGLIRAEPRDRQPDRPTLLDWTWGEAIEVIGLALTAGILGILLALWHISEAGTWQFWGLSMLVIVWAGLRQGLRGGAVAAGTGGLLALTVATILGGNPSRLNTMQGNLLAQCSAALLVGASAGWVRASEARYRQVIGHIPVVLYSARVPRWVPARFMAQRAPQLGHDKREPGLSLPEFAEITLVSPASRHILGCAPEALVGPFAAWLERILPADREIVTAALAQLCLQKQPVTCEYRLASGLAGNDAAGPMAGNQQELADRRGPLVRWARDTLVPHYSSDGHLDGWEGVVEDITAQRTLALDLRRTSTMLHALIAHLPTGIFFVQGATGRPILVNNRARQLLGQREDLAAGIDHVPKIYRLHRPDGSEYPWEELPVARALREGATSMAEDIVVYRADGRRVPLVSWAAPVDLGGLGKADAAVWVLEDLSALKKAEARQESEARLRAVFETQYQDLVESLPLMLLQFNPQGQITFLNSATQHILGFDAQELAVPGFWQGRMHADDQSQFRTALERTLKGYVARAELRFRAKDASEKVGYALLQPNVHEDKVVGSTCLVVDMTLQRRLEQQLQRSQRLEMVGRLAGGTVHDFNNLLTVMLGMASLAQASLPVDHPAYLEVQRILEVGEQATHLAGQILAFSRQKRVPYQDLDLNTVVVHTLKLLRGVFPANIQVESRLAPVEVKIEGDETQLKQVLMNLCLNARDAMPEGGKLTVQTDVPANSSEPSPTALEINFRSQKSWVRLIVQDSGQGMSDEVQARIFEPFFSTKERGTGLGLAVVQQIVESHGGRIEVHSKTQEGTCFEIWLPATSPRGVDS